MATQFSSKIIVQDGFFNGPWCTPRQMLGDQTYDAHGSIHDDATAQKLGFQAGTIEGPTHFSQFAPICVDIWGDRWLSQGCLSVHYRNAVFEGEEVRAIVECPADGAVQSAIRMEKRDGTEVLTGTASIGPEFPKSALEMRLEVLNALDDLVILRDVAVGMKTDRIPVVMKPDQHMGDLYPFTLNQKLEVITEPSPLYGEIIPLEMVSVLLNYKSREYPFPTKGPCVNLFADQEIRLLDGPLRVSQPYEIIREVVAMSGSRRTESIWSLTRVYHPGEDQEIATMVLNTASLKASYAPYEQEYAQLYGKNPRG